MFRVAVGADEAARFEETRDQEDIHLATVVQRQIRLVYRAPTGAQTWRGAARGAE
jgi:hypothetical protein